MSSSQAGETKKLEAIVLGAGVIGLSIAHELTDRGLKVAVVAKDLPEDLQSTGFASPWAGADWSASLASNESERRRDLVTYRRFAQLAQDFPELCERREFRHYWSTEEEGKGDAQFKDDVIGYRPLDPSEVLSPWKYGSVYQSYTLNTPLYLAHLANTLRGKGVQIKRHTLESLDEAYSLPASAGLDEVNLIINATALGSRSLKGVEDPLVYPAKGQTVLVRAPGVKAYYGVKSPHKTLGQKRYIIPRPGPRGQDHVILGGCYLPNDWDPTPNPVVAEQILKDAHELAPQLDGREGKGTWRDIEIVSHNVGLRPVRTGGIRLELEQRTVGQYSLPGSSSKCSKIEGESVLPAQNDGGRQVAVVHAYGIGAAGYQGSLGVAEEVEQLVHQWLQRTKVQ